MRVLLVHNFYQRPGGEDEVFYAESKLLQSHGHEVRRLTVHNSSLEGKVGLRLAVTTVWSSSAYRRMRSILKEFSPDVVHVHNTFPLISPAVYYASQEEGVPVVQTLHNFRLTCVNGLLFRSGRPCETCLGQLVPWSGVVHACYRHSRVASAAVAAMLGYHKLRGTYRNMVDAYIALTDFSRNLLIRAGLPPELVHVKPNFVIDDPGVGRGSGMYALFVGRLSEEKGIRTLLAAWRELGSRVPLMIIGDGPLASLVESEARHARIDWLGQQSREEVYKRMKDASLLIVPSESYENFPMTIAEAFATGLPVVGTNHGGISAIVDHGRNGMLFGRGDHQDLAQTVSRILSHPLELVRMRKEARRDYESKYNASANYNRLISVYESVAR